MIPTASTVQAGTLMALATGVLPHLTLPYAQGTTAAAAALLAFMAQDSDRAAERRVVEINSMQDIFADASEHLRARDPALADALYSRSRDLFVSFSLADLDERRRDHLPVLIALHEKVERSDSAWAKAIEARILRHYVATAEGRALVIPAMG
jgi:hypothetical protein